MARKIEINEQEQEYFRTAFYESRETSKSALVEDFLEDNYAKEKWFLGLCSPLTAASKTKHGEMRVFYPLAEPELSDVPLNLSPVLIYKNHDGVVSFFLTFK